jgi:hypothetical protein
MPAPINISIEEKKWIKTYLNDIYGVDVKDSYDCKKLYELINERNNINISLTTLRRFFNLIPDNGFRSLYSMNQLAMAIGFENYQKFKSYVHRFDINLINQNIQLYSLDPNIYSVQLLSTLKNLSFNQWDETFQILSIISLAIKNKDEYILNFIIQQQNDKSVEFNEKQIIALQEFYFEARKGNDFVIDFIKNSLENSLFLQVNLLQSYVDERNLNTFYGDWLSVSFKKTVPDLLIFKTLLLCQLNFVNAEILTAKQLFKKVSDLKEKANFNLHPILHARICAWNVIFYNDFTHIEDYYKKLENPFEIADFTVILSRLMWEFHSENYIEILNQVVIDSFPLHKNYFEKGRYNILLLTLAINYFKQIEYQQATKYFTLFDKSLIGFDITNLTFYTQWIEKFEVEFSKG